MKQHNTPGSNKNTFILLLSAGILWVHLTKTIAMPDNGKIITLTIKNIHNTKGKILVSLFNCEGDFLKKPFKELVNDITTTGNLVVTLENIPPGTYTVGVIHDQNNNGKLDMNFIGIPKEPYGISKAGKRNYGPPSYERAKFEVENKDLEMTISL